MQKNYKNTAVSDFAFLVLFIVPLWRPISTWVINVDAAGRAPLFLLLSALFFSFYGIRKIAIRKPISFYLLFAIYLFVNGIIHESNQNYEVDGLYVMAVNIFMPPMYMLLLICMAYLDFDKTLRCVTVSLLIYCLLCLIFGEVTDTGRFGGDLNANGMAECGAFCFYCLLLEYMRQRISLSRLVLLSIIPLGLIITTGSRTAFILVVFVLVLSLSMFYQKGRSISVVVVLFIAIGLLFGVYYTLFHTMLGERLLDSTTQMEGGSMATGTFFDKLGDRGPQYYWSWPYFLENPLCGIGLGNWRKISGSPIVLHSEWLIQYCENGIVALTLYLAFYISLVRDLIRSFPHIVGIERQSRNVVLYVLLSVILWNFSTWTYNALHVFAFYGFAFALIQKSRTIVSNE